MDSGWKGGMSLSDGTSYGMVQPSSKGNNPNSNDNDEEVVLLLEVENIYTYLGLLFGVVSRSSVM